jgi:hypothetical protein
MCEKESGSSMPRLNRKQLRDKRIAALSIDRVPLEDRRACRAATQAALAKELHQAMTACLAEGLLMPIASLLRSLIDTTALGIWFVKYAPDDQITESVAHRSTTDLIEKYFVDEDRITFAFLFLPVKDTDHLFYREVLHFRSTGTPSTWRCAQGMRFQERLGSTTACFRPTECTVIFACNLPGADSFLSRCRRKLRPRAENAFDDKMLCYDTRSSKGRTNTYRCDVHAGCFMEAQDPVAGSPRTPCRSANLGA